VNEKTSNPLLNLPWRFRSPADPLSGYLELVDAQGNEIATFYSVFQAANREKARYILEKCNSEATPEVVAAVATEEVVVTDDIPY